MTDMTQDLALELFSYSEGQLYVKGDISKKKVGDVIKGSLTDTGYLIFMYKYKKYRLHRLIWIYHNGEIPLGYNIDHHDTDKQNNDISNLRLLTKADNLKAATAILRGNNTSGFRGVSFDKVTNKWVVRIRVNGKYKNKGRFTTFEEAVKERLISEHEYGYTEIHNMV